MTYEQFKLKYLGTPVDTDGAYGAQCMDLMHKFKYEVLGETDYFLLAAASAYLVWENFSRPDIFEKIPNTPTNYPVKGDIIFFKKTVGPHGHVAVVEKADVNTVTILEQNWNGVQKVSTRKTDYKDVSGWLRYKKQPVEDPCTTEIKRLTEEKERISKSLAEMSSSNADNQRKLLMVEKAFADQNKIVIELKSSLTEQEKDFKKQLDLKRTEIARLSDELHVLSGAFDNQKTEFGRQHKELLTYTQDRVIQLYMTIKSLKKS